MTSLKRFSWAALAGALVLPACGMFGAGEQEEPTDYWVGQQRWSTEAPSQGQEVLRRNLTRGSEEETETTLEKLQNASRRLEGAAAENEKLRTELASVTATLEQVRADNASMQRYADSLQGDRESMDQQFQELQGRMKTLEENYRKLAEDLLAERIRRVRVERELILAKIGEAESATDG